MFSLFNQPYPSTNMPMQELRKAAVIGLFVGLFLLIFQPFGINLWETPNKALKVIGFGAVTFVITAINFVIWPRLFPKLFAEQTWTIGREILFVTTNVLLIAIANRLYLSGLLEPKEESGLNWLNMIVVTFLIAVFPVTGLVLLNYIRELKKYSRAAADLPIHSSVTDNIPTMNTVVTAASELPDSIVTLVADNEKDKLTLPIESLVFIESSDNYCTVVYLKNEQPAKPLLRSSLSRLEKQIAQPHIVRCHRSYVVNLNRVERVTGNAQGYKLHLLGGQFQLPVARQYNETLVAELKAL
ncbi:LytTR family transcriptional regulator [Spirosoma sp. HMF4905]|uniref:LytTR family transcriptional regulator n=2 Tax=Spirosoma arboris TaxID=2682092 RepID=A0A7K1SHS5_9BACT|nr:LytTR family transcriptional regulator [Spirosoma arboris]